MKVKVLSVKNNVLHLSIDGTPYSYVIGRPQPLTASDLRAYLDSRMLDAIANATAALTSPGKRTLFTGVHSHFTRGGVSPITSANHLFVDYIRKNAIPLDVEGQGCFVLTPEMLEKLEEGDV